MLEDFPIKNQAKIEEKTTNLDVSWCPRKGTVVCRGLDGPLPPPLPLSCSVGNQLPPLVWWYTRDVMCVSGDIWCVRGGLYAPKEGLSPRTSTHTQPLGHGWVLNDCLNKSLLLCYMSDCFIWIVWCDFSSSNPIRCDREAGDAFGFGHPPQPVVRVHSDYGVCGMWSFYSNLWRYSLVAFSYVCHSEGYLIHTVSFASIYLESLRFSRKMILASVFPCISFRWHYPPFLIPDLHCPQSHGHRQCVEDKLWQIRKRSLPFSHTFLRFLSNLTVILQ